MDKMRKNNLVKILVMALAFAGVAVAGTGVDSEIQDLKLEKEKLNSEIKKLNSQILATDSMLKADDARFAKLKERYKADTERRQGEIKSLNDKIRKVASQLQEERNKQAQAKNRSENVAAKRKALSQTLVALCKKFESQIAQTIPWNKESRLERARSLTRDIESGNANVEEGFSRLKALIAEETKFGDEVTLINTPMTRKNGELVNAQVLKIGNQWMVYSDENATVYGSLVRKIDEAGNVTFDWNEDLSLAERDAVKFALDVKQAKKPPQVVTLPVSLSIAKTGK